MQTRKKAGLGQLVRERREELGLSQREVAALIGKTPSALSAIEHGRVLIPSRETRDQIGAVLRLTNVEMLVAAADAAGDPMRALWRYLLDTGCRKGEALALAWPDLDLDAGTARVWRTLTKDDANRRVIGESAKTKAGNRLVSLDPETVAALRWQRADQRVRKLAARPVWQERGVVFDRGDGAVVHPDVVARRLGRLCAEAGVPPQTSHGLRHTVITLAVLAGVPLPVIQRRVGHGSIQVTSDVYVAVDEPSDRAASAAVADLVRAARTVRTGADRADEAAENRPSVTTTVTTENRKPSF